MIVAYDQKGIGGCPPCFTIYPFGDIDNPNTKDRIRVGILTIRFVRDDDVLMDIIHIDKRHSSLSRSDFLDLVECWHKLKDRNAVYQGNEKLYTT